MWHRAGSTSFETVELLHRVRQAAPSPPLLHPEEASAWCRAGLPIRDGSEPNPSANKAVEPRQIAKRVLELGEVFGRHL